VSDHAICRMTHRQGHGLLVAPQDTMPIPASLAALLAGMTPEQLEVLGKALTGVDPQEAADLLECWKDKRPDESLAERLREESNDDR